MKNTSNILLTTLFAILIFFISSCDSKKSTSPTLTATVMITLSTNDGGSLIGSTIVLQNHGGAGYQLTATSETAIFTNIPYGSYSVIVTHSGYYLYQDDNLSVQDNTVSHSIELLTTRIHIGEIIQFGTFLWRVLDIKPGKALIISMEDILWGIPYHVRFEGVIWANCSLRAYMNNEFYNSDDFTAIDRSRIALTVLQNPANPVYGTNGGGDTVDRIFLLSIAEAQQYFKDDADRVCKNSNNAPIGWTLRTPGREHNRVSYVSRSGGINFDGVQTGVITSTASIRPALWLNLVGN